MTNLERFGKALCEVRERSGITQEEAVSRSSTYSEASGLRKIERGEQRPKRRTIIDLLIKGFGERDSSKIDELLDLAGYAPLSDAELSKLRLASRPVPKPGSDTCGKPPVNPLPPRLLKAWTACILICTGAAVLLGWRENWFVWLCCLLYSGLYTVSVLLESAYEFRGRETVRASVLAGSVALATSLCAIWIDNKLAAGDQAEGLWIALITFVLAAILQWVLVRPALPAYTIVRTRFQSHTAQAAHLKNTVYFILIVFAFWIPPRHCVEVFRHQVRLGRILTGPAESGTFCPPPGWLWVVLLVVAGLSLPMRSRLLDNLRPGPGNNLYINLFYIRALLFFLLSILCLVWYSNSFPFATSSFAAKFMIRSSP